MREKKDASERCRLLQVSAPPDVCAWWDSTEDGEKSKAVIKIIRAELKRKAARAKA